jgi:hypothetical protein
MTYRVKTYAGSLKAERAHIAVGVTHLKLGFGILKSVAWSRVGTLLWILRDALDLRGFIRLGTWLDNTSIRCYRRCAKICGEIAAAGPQ